MATQKEAKAHKAFEVKEALARAASTEDVLEVIALTTHENQAVRVRALKEMCPCRVKGDITPFWERVLCMVNDADPEVRAQVLHTICDGSPAHLEDAVMEAVSNFGKDPDKKVRRAANQVMAKYKATGKWNVL
jgi:HEAT repeat protein